MSAPVFGLGGLAAGIAGPSRILAPERFSSLQTFGHVRPGKFFGFL